MWMNSLASFLFMIDQNMSFWTSNDFCLVVELVLDFHKIWIHDIILGLNAHDTWYEFGLQDQTNLEFELIKIDLLFFKT